MMLFTFFVVSLIVFMVCAGTTPNYKGCLDEAAKGLPYCDEGLSLDERVDDLLDRLSLEEQINSISPQPALGDTCGDHTAGKPEIGLPDYFWLTETNTNVAALCYTDKYKCPSTFVGPLGMGASFNRTSWGMKGSVLGTEMRAFHNLAWHRANTGNLIGLTGFGPNLNIARDPRFGRISELPGEDPYHSGTYGYHMIEGMQEKDDNGHPKMLAYLKHFTAYSTETNRGHDTYNISMYDFWDTYLAQYEITFKANASGVMCSYDAENGVPSCANDYILNQVIRGKFGQTNALVTTDCGAVSNMLGAPANAPSPEHAAAWTINNGTDIEMGSTIWTDHMFNATKIGLVSEKTVRTSARRAFRQLFVAGRFDDSKNIAWSSLGVDDINTTFAQQVVRESALQSMVLLKNDKKILPLKRGSNIAVVGMFFVFVLLEHFSLSLSHTHTLLCIYLHKTGPMATNQDLMSDYAGGTGESGYVVSFSSSIFTRVFISLRQR